MKTKYFDTTTTVAAALCFLKVPHQLIECWDGAQVRFPWCNGDVACHGGTSGSLAGQVETYQFPWDKGDVSVMTPEKAAAKIANLYYSGVEG